MNLLYLLMAGLLLFLFLQLASRFLLALAKNNAFKPAVLKVFPLIELGAWIAFSFWAAWVLFGNMRYYDQVIAVMSSLFVFAIGWFVFRDFFSGMMLRSEYKLEKGQVIKTPIAEGRITKLGRRFMELENEKGEKIRIPYSQISNQWISLPADTEKSFSHQMAVRLSGHIEPSVLKNKINQEMMGMPWIIGPPPNIKISKDQEGVPVLEIRYDLLKEEHALVVEEKIRQLVSRHTGE
jgi:hypothetical protein